MSDYTISTDRSKLDVALIHRFLSEESYWAKGRSREQVERSIENSLPYGAYAGDELVGFAVEEHRGRGIGQMLVEAALGDPELADVYRWFLGTADAHELYRRYGFDELKRVERFMAREDAENARRCADG